MEHTQYSEKGQYTLQNVLYTAYGHTPNLAKSTSMRVGSFSCSLSGCYDNNRKM